jgi:ATP-dependent protease ClpP protease subunit
MKELKLQPSIFCGEPSISSSDTKLVIAVRDALLNPKTVAGVVMRLVHVDPTTDVTMLINSPGGDTRTMCALLAGMHACPAKIHTRITGVAASAMAIVWAHGHTLSMAKHARVMFHGTSTGGATGNTVELREVIDAQLDIYTSMFKTVIAKNIMTAEEVEHMFQRKQDMFFTYEQLKARGVVQ